MTVVPEPLGCSAYDPSIALSSVPSTSFQLTGCGLPVVLQHVVVLDQAWSRTIRTVFGLVPELGEHLRALHRVDPLWVVLEVGDHCHDSLRRRRDVDAGAGLVGHEPYLIRPVWLTATGSTASQRPPQGASGRGRIRSARRRTRDPAGPWPGSGRVVEQLGDPVRPAPDDHRAASTKPVSPSRTVSGAPPESPDDHRQATGRGLQRSQAEALRIQPGQPGPHRQCEHLRLLQFADAPRPAVRAPVSRDGVAPGQPVDHRLQPSRCGPSPTKTSSGGHPARRAVVQHQPPGPQQGGEALLRDEPADGRRSAIGPVGADRRRPEQVGIHRRRQPQQPDRASRAQCAADPPLGVRRDRGQVITPVADPAQQGRAPGTPGPPGLVAVGEPDDALRPGPAQRRSQQSQRRRGAEDHPRGPGLTDQSRRPGPPPAGSAAAGPGPDHRIAAVGVGSRRPRAGRRRRPARPGRAVRRCRPRTTRCRRSGAGSRW